MSRQFGGLGGALGRNDAVAANESTPQQLRMTSPEALNLIREQLNALADQQRRYPDMIAALTQAFQGIDERMGELGKAVARIEQGMKKKRKKR